ncbi:hypothetical protein Pelo_9830 [Pelomyxa schiedti]|nr:hypothetical protein Pelo_9830 [Pelomyxa schiedti]
MSGYKAEMVAVAGREQLAEFVAATSPRAVVVYFTGQLAVPCFEPAVRDRSASAGVAVARVDVDNKKDNAGLIAEFGVTGIPTFVAVQGTPDNIIARLHGLWVNDVEVYLCVRIPVPSLAFM